MTKIVLRKACFSVDDYSYSSPSSIYELSTYFTPFSVGAMCLPGEDVQEDDALYCISYLQVSFGLLKVFYVNDDSLKRCFISLKGALGDPFLLCYERFIVFVLSVFYQVFFSPVSSENLPYRFPDFSLTNAALIKYAGI